MSVFGGDSRVNSNAGLSMYHTLFIRYHNELENGLHQLNPEWNGERLYQETRKIVIASLQHITFKDLLPLILGPRYIKKYNLDVASDGYFQGRNCLELNQLNRNTLCLLDFHTQQHFGHMFVGCDITA